ncbi:hypothetical protein J7K03_01360 [bacterium]|nr:hypothetical protein [bacterium]
MRLKILGTRGEIKASAPYHSKHSGILLDKKILFDIGEEEFLDYNPKYIFITHLHPDHAFFLRKPEKRDKIKVPIYTPENLKGKGPVNLGSYKIVSIPTIHSKKVKSVAFLIEKNSKKILYTGDMIWIRKKYHYLFRGLDLVITETSFYRKGGLVRKDKKTGEVYGHTGVQDLVNLFKKFTSNVVFLHFGSWFYKDIKRARKNLARLAKKNKINITIAYDGLEIVV